MLVIPKQYQSFEFISPTSWEEIFAAWKKGEAWQEMWKKHWEERGYSSWEEWRKKYAAPLKPEKLEWFLYKINDPVGDFPQIYGVPTKSWIKNQYGGMKLKLLKDIVPIPYVQNHPKVNDIKNNFPKKTMFTGIIFDGKIILIEGMHRACALASWKKDMPLKSEIAIALAEWKEKDIPVIGSGNKN